MAIQQVTLYTSGGTEYTGANPLPITGSVTSANTTSTLGAGAQTTVGNASAVSVVATNAARKMLILQNTGANNARISGVNTVTATSGIQLLASGGFISFEPPFIPTNQLFAIAEAGSTTILAIEAT